MTRPTRSGGCCQRAGDGRRVRVRPDQDAHPRGHEGRQGQGPPTRQAAKLSATQERTSSSSTALVSTPSASLRSCSPSPVHDGRRRGQAPRRPSRRRRLARPTPARSGQDERPRGVRDLDGVAHDGVELAPHPLVRSVPRRSMLGSWRPSTRRRAREPRRLRAPHHDLFRCAWGCRVPAEHSVKERARWQGVQQRVTTGNWTRR